MTFEPAPANDFLQFMREYYQRCLQRVPQIRAVAAKWSFEDLIPGLSDFDTRFILADDMTSEDWGRMSIEVGQTHTEMCRRFPRWARNLEHLPGINMTESEVVNPILFYPEFQQWTFYDGDPSVIEHVEQQLAKIQWSSRDELYHLKRFATFCGPYQRGIDPPVNLGPWESKYPLHSRFMHYFAPAVQSAVSLALRRNVRGKFEGLRLARGQFPNPEIIQMVLETAERHYETPELYQEPLLTEVERKLGAYLQQAWAALAGQITLTKPGHADDSVEVHRKVGALEVDPIVGFFEGVKFGRLLKGRLLFYAEAIPWFDSAWLIRNELGRIVKNFYVRPLAMYGQARFGEELAPEEVLDRLRGDLLSAKGCNDLNRFVSLASQPMESGHEREHAQNVAALYDVVLMTMEQLSADLLEWRTRSKSSGVDRFRAPATKLDPRI